MIDTWIKTFTWKFANHFLVFLCILEESVTSYTQNLKLVSLILDDLVFESQFVQN